MDQPDPGAIHLTGARLASELTDDLCDLSGSGRADRVALGLEPAGGVDGDFPAQAGPPLLRGDAAGARLEKAEPFGGDDLGDRESVVKLHHIHVRRPAAGLPIRGLRGPFRSEGSAQVLLVVEAHRVGSGR